MDVAAALEQRLELLEELKNKEYAAVGIADEFDPSLGAQFSKLEREKCDLKKQFIQGHTQRLMLECLTSPPDPDSWPSTHKAASEKALEGSAKKLKNAKQAVEDVKNDLQKKSEAAEKCYEVVQEKKAMLEKKLEELVDKCKALATLQAQQMEAESGDGKGLSGKDLEESADKKRRRLEQTQQWVQQCRETVALKRTELERLGQELEKVRSLKDGLQAALRQAIGVQHSQVASATTQKQKLQQQISDLEKLSGIRLGKVGEDCLTLHFVSDAPNQREMAAEVTLVFGDSDIMGSPVLTKIQTDASSLQTEDLMADPLLRANLPSLVTKLRARWQAHVPLLTEIQQIHERFAVDWIAEEKCLRAMVGPGGGVVCTLAVPSTYPLSRSITLSSIQGADIPDLAQLKPEHGSSLQEWVSFLEDKFGKP